MRRNDYFICLGVTDHSNGYSVSEFDRLRLSISACYAKFGCCSKSARINHCVNLTWIWILSYPGLGQACLTPLANVGYVWI